MNGYNYAVNSPITNSDPSGALHVGPGGSSSRPPASRPGCNSGSYACHGVSHWNGDSSRGTIRRPGNGNPSRGVSYPVGMKLPPASMPRHQRQAGLRNVISQMLGTGKNPGDLARYNQAKQAFCAEYPSDYMCGDMGSVSTHTLLDILGLFPVIGPFADGGNAIYYGIEGKPGEATFSLLSLIPVVGDVAGAGKLSIKAGKALKAAKTCKISSFVPGTEVLMADGSRKQIQDVEVGDEVQATDPVTGETTSEPVLATITSKGDKNLVQITIDPSAPARFRAVADTPAPTVATVADNSKLRESGVLISTDTHPFWVAGDINAWVEAADLKRGMWLRTSAGTHVQITATRTWTTDHQRVHNLTIAHTPTYHVVAGSTSVLVHNCGGPLRVSPAAQDWGTKGAHVHVGNHEVRIFPDGSGGVGAEPIRLRNGTATPEDVERALNEIRTIPQFRADLIEKSRSAMGSMNNNEWGMRSNRGVEMHFLIRALENMG